MKKILIGEKQYIGKQNVDNFIDLNLDRTIDSIKKDTVENVFDFESEFQKERNNSLKFCIYGEIQSKFGHCDNLLIEASVSDLENNHTELLFLPTKSINNTAYTLSFLSHKLSIGDLSKNIFGARKGFYNINFELDRNLILNSPYSSTTKYINLNIFDKVNELYGSFSMPFLFYSTNGNQIDFGTESAEVNDNNDIIEINNNFPFFYDRHWVKLNVEPEGSISVFFVESEHVISESLSSDTISISLKNKSKYGLEKAKVVIDYAIDKNGNKLTNADFGTDFIFVEPIFSWAVGEQLKYFNVSIINDLFVENQLEQITFKLIPIANVRIKNNENYKFVLKIEDDDSPSLANFESLNPIIYEPPQYISSNSAYTFNILFDKPIEVPDQSFKIKLVPAETSAVIGVDFYIDPNNIYSDELLINAPMSTPSSSFSIYVNYNHEYDLDKIVTVEIIKNSSNISPGNIYPKLKCTIKDGMKYKFTRYIIPFSESKKNGIFKMIYASTAHVAQTMELEKDTLSLSGPYLTPQRKVTNLFNCKLKIKNSGTNRIVWNNSFVNVGDSFEIPMILSTITSNFYIDLPSNKSYNSNDNSFSETKYTMYIKDVSKSYPSTVPDQNWIAAIDKNSYFDWSIDTDTTIASEILGDSKKHLITEIHNAKSSYNTVNDLCSESAVFLNQIVRYNGAILTPRNESEFINNTTNILSYNSYNRMFFNDKTVLEKCISSGNTLPVGVDYLPNLVVNEKYVMIDFGKVYVQAGFNILLFLKTMKMGVLSNLSLNLSAYRYFYNWNDVMPGTKAEAKLKIKNNGVKDVTILGNLVVVGDTIELTNNIIDFDALTIALPTNDVYDSVSNSYLNANYDIKFSDFKIFTLNTFSIVSDDVNIGNINLVGGTFLNIPNYYVEYEYQDVEIGATVFGVPNCSINVTNLISNTIKKNVKTNAALFFKNTGSVMTNVSIVQNQISPTCSNSTIPYQII